MKEIVHPFPVEDPIHLEKYGGKWIAVLNRRIIDCDANLERLCNRLEKQGIEEKALLIPVPRPGLIL